MQAFGLFLRWAQYSTKCESSAQTLKTMNQRFALPLLVAASAIGIAAPSFAQGVPQSHKIVSKGQVIHPVVKEDIVLKDTLMNIFAIEDDGSIYGDDGTMIGRIDPDGSIYSGGGEYIGRIDPDGSVYSEVPPCGDGVPTPLVLCRLTENWYEFSLPQSTWYNKPLPTFVDALALVRQRLWQARLFHPLAEKPIWQKHQKPC
ncbi:MAG: hypothetical protein ACKO7W_21455 [Elainella sp.]